MATPLADVQKGECLYCERRVESGEIDHFVPWSRYPRDLAHNLLLAHKQCNRHKSDLLAAETHLDRWLARNQAHGNAISEAARTANIIVDLSGTLSVAGWAYAHGASLHAATWLEGDEVDQLVSIKASRMISEKHRQDSLLHFRKKCVGNARRRNRKHSRNPV